MDEYQSNAMRLARMQVRRKKQEINRKGKRKERNTGNKQERKKERKKHRNI